MLINGHALLQSHRRRKYEWLTWFAGFSNRSHRYNSDITADNLACTTIKYGRLYLLLKNGDADYICSIESFTMTAGKLMDLSTMPYFQDASSLMEISTSWACKRHHR